MKSFKGVKNPTQIGEQKNDIPVQFDISEAGKKAIKERADSVGVDVSKYIRSRVIDEDIYRIIDSKGVISQNCIEISDCISCCIRERKIEQRIVDQVIAKLNTVFYTIEDYIHKIPECLEDPELKADVVTGANKSSEHKSTHIQFKVCEELKEYIDNKSEELGMNLSQFLRVTSLTNSTIYVLKNANYVARNIVRIQEYIAKLSGSDLIGEKYIKIISSKAQDVFGIFIQLTYRLTKIDSIDDICSEEV